MVQESQSINETPPAAKSDSDEQKQNRSTIAFPYSHLGDAEQIATALQNRGQTASSDELAAELGTTVKSGSFRMKMATARTFGVIETRRGQVSLTPLGKRLIDPAERDRARVEAFLHVPLFNKIYEQYKGGLLPPSKGLETAMEQLGVSPKQTDRARQALQRSAERAGFFRNGKDRLVVPPAHEGASSVETEKKRPDGVATSVDLAPPLAQLWVTLLDDGDSWPADKVAEYVQNARNLRRLLDA